MKTIDTIIFLNNKRLRRMPKKADGTYLFSGVHVKGSFTVEGNELTSLEGSPEIVDGNFICSGNNGLTSVVGGPRIVKNNFYCRGPDMKKFTEEEIRRTCMVWGHVFV